MIRVKLLGSRDFAKDLGSLTLGGVLAMLPAWVIATYLFPAAPHMASMASCVAGTLTIFSALRLRRGNKVKFLPGATASVFSGASLSVLFPLYPLLGLLTFGGLFGLARATEYPRWNQKWAVILTTAATAILGGVVFGQLPHIPWLEAALPAPVLNTSMFGLFGLYMGLGALPAHVKVRRDLVGARYRQLAGSLRPEIKESVLRVYVLYGRFLRTIDPASFASEEEAERFDDNLQELTVRLFSLCARWQEVEVHLTALQSQDLAARVIQIEDRVRNATDSVAREQYEKVLESLRRRQQDTQEVVTARERVVSSLTYHLTSLEEAYVSLVKARCTTADSVAGEIEGFMRHVGQLTMEMDMAARSLDDLTSMAGTPLPAASSPAPAAALAPASASAPAPAAAAGAPSMTSAALPPAGTDTSGTRGSA